MDLKWCKNYDVFIFVNEVKLTICLHLKKFWIKSLALSAPEAEHWNKTIASQKLLHWLTGVGFLNVKLFQTWIFLKKNLHVSKIEKFLHKKIVFLQYALLPQTNSSQQVYFKAWAKPKVFAVSEHTFNKLI